MLTIFRTEIKKEDKIGKNKPLNKFDLKIQKERHKKRREKKKKSGVK